MALTFEWDDAKASQNIAKHRVPFDEASTIFGDPLSVTIEDPVQSFEGEARFITIGLSYRGGMLVVVHSDRGDNIRIISARTATRNETRSYEEGR